MISEQVDLYFPLLKNRLSENQGNEFNWEIKYSNGKGRGVFATKNYSPNEIILLDKPLLIGPKQNKEMKQKICVSCNASLHDESVKCTFGCGLSICKSDCAKLDEHRNCECELLKRWKPKDTEDDLLAISNHLVIIRSLFLSSPELKILQLMQANGNKISQSIVKKIAKSFHNFPIDDKEICERIQLASAVIMTNAFESVRFDENREHITLCGLFPLGGTLNHKCAPNTHHGMDNNLQMVFRASKAIAAGEELFASYTPLLWSTSMRRAHLLMTKQFFCKCERCEDQTEFGTMISAMYCNVAKCNGFILPEDPLNITSNWLCNICAKLTTFKEAIDKNTVLTCIIKSHMNDSLAELKNFYNKIVLNKLPPTNYLSIEVQLKIIWMIGKLNECTIDDYQLQRNLCVGILQILEQLNTGECVLKGLISHEIVKCNKILNEKQENPKLQSIYEL